MPRVALCLRGAVGKHGFQFFQRGDLYKAGTYVDFEACYRGYKKNLFDANNDDYTFDTFIHSWNKDLENDLRRLYNPVNALFEDNSLYADEISSKIDKNRPFDFASVSSALSMQKVLDLVLMTEESNKYDIIALFRPDVLLWTPLNLKSYDVSSNMYCSGDYHFIMNGHNEKAVKKFRTFYNSIERGQPYPIKVQYYMGQKMQADMMKAGQDFNCIRKLEQSRRQFGVNVDEIRQIYQISEPKRKLSVSC